MDQQTFQKPSVEEWLKWAGIVVDRLTDCVHVYKKPPFDDVFLSDADCQRKTDTTLKLLHRLHSMVDKSETPSDSVPDVHHHDEQTIDGVAVVFREVLTLLPTLSTDMQLLLKSPWQKMLPNQMAERIFAGEGKETQGIGSGNQEHGRLPMVLASLLEREEMGDTRQPREALLRHSEPRRHDVEGRERWTSQNSRFLRTAGRVE